MDPKIFKRSSGKDAQVANTKRLRGWRQIFFGFRTRILAWYVVLMALSTLISIIAIRQFLLIRLENQNDSSLSGEIEQFRRLKKEANPTTTKLFRDEIAAIFNIYLSRNIPNEDEFFITLLNGKLHRSSPNALPAHLDEDSDLVKHWAELTQPERGKHAFPYDTIIYMAEPIIRGKTHGVFVVVHSENGTHKQVERVVVVTFEVMIAVLSGGSVLAWLVAGQVLAPLRLLTETAHSIGESDLTRRIPVEGVDEIAELTITFNEMLDRLQTAFASQREFINDASHELRTPITIIRGHLELLGDDPQERRETLELVTDELDRMSRFVDDLLLLAKAEQPNFLNLETVNIGLFTEELYTKATALAKRDWRLDKKGVGYILADRHRLTQAIMNLAQNATQHTTDGSVIALGSARTNRHVRFWVRDTGVGIAVDDRERIFDRFARGSRSRRRSEGAGLGLSIVKAIAIAHGGWVDLKSKMGQGSTFTIVIRLDPQQEVRSD